MAFLPVPPLPEFSPFCLPGRPRILPLVLWSLLSFRGPFSYFLPPHTHTLFSLPDHLLQTCLPFSPQGIHAGHVTPSPSILSVSSLSHGNIQPGGHNRAVASCLDEFPSGSCLQWPLRGRLPPSVLGSPGAPCPVPVGGHPIPCVSPCPIGQQSGVLLAFGHFSG